MDRKKRKNNKYTRYSNSVVFYKSLSCRISLSEDSRITKFCVENHLSKSIFLATAAMYCLNNKVSAKELLNSTATSETYEYRDYMDDEYEVDDE